MDTIVGTRRYRENSHHPLAVAAGAERGRANVRTPVTLD